MIMDYASGCIRPKSRYYRKKSINPKDLFFTARILWKTIGFMLLVTLVLSISSTFWYGLKIQLALDQIGSKTAINKELSDENRMLIAQHDLMLTQQHMEKKARKLGLQPALENQRRFQ